MRQLSVPIVALLLGVAATPALAGGGHPEIGTIQVGPYRVAMHNDSPTLTSGQNTISVEIAALPADMNVRLRLDGPRGEAIAVPLSNVLVLEGPAGGHGDDDHASDQQDDHGAAKQDSHGASTQDSHGAVKQDDHAAAKQDSHVAAGRDPHGAAGTTAQAASQPGGHGAPADDGHGARQPAHEQPGAEAEGGHAATAPKDEHSSSSASSTAKSDHAAVSTVVDSHAAMTAAATDVHKDELVAFLARGSVTLPSTGTWTASVVLRDPHGQVFVGETQLEVAEGGPNRLYLGGTGSLILGSIAFGMLQRRRSLSRLLQGK